MLRIGVSAFEQLKVGQLTDIDPLAEVMILLMVTTHDNNK